MRNRTEIKSPGIPDKLKRFADARRQWLNMLGLAIFGYVMSNSFIFSGIAPFGVAAVAAAPGRLCYPAAFGALIGYIFSLGSVSSMKYFAAVLLCALCKWLLELRGPKISEVASSVITAVAGMGAAGAIMVYTMDFILYDILLVVSELFLCCGASYFFARGAASMRLGFSGASHSDISCIVVSFAIVIMGFSGITAGGLSVGRIISVLAILLCARHGGEGAGAISGVTAGIAMGLSGGDYSYTVSAYAFGGLIAGIFGRTGRLAAASAFVVVNALTALFVSDTVDIYTALAEIFAASVIFMAIPGSLINKLRIGSVGQENQAGEAARSVLRDRLHDISTALLDISDTTRKVSRELGKIDTGSFSEIYTQVADRVCRRCGMRAACWQFKYGDTINAMDDCMRILKLDGSITKERLPVYFVKTCCKAEAFVGELNSQFQQQVSKGGIQRRVSQVRSVITDQFEGMAVMIKSVSREMCDIKIIEPEKIKRVKEYFEKGGLLASGVICYNDEFSRLHLELSLPSYQLARLNKTRSTFDLCDILEAEFDSPVIVARDRGVSVSYSEKATFTAEMGACQIPCGHNKLCGDAYSYTRGRSGLAHMILSDGMGSGGEAAVDSAMASGLISKLLSVGVEHEAALKMVNSALLIKSGEESLATIDICTLDLFTGRADFYKAGAAPSYILRGDKAGYVESSSLPAGILRGVSFEKSSLKLHPGDIILMVSDGVVASGSDWLISELEASKNTDIQRLCEKIASTAKMRRIGERDDDITVLAAALRNGV